MTIRHNQRGFSPLVIIVIILVLAGAGVAAWRVTQKSDTTNTPSSSDSTSDENPVVVQTTYTSVNEDLKFDYPSDWKAEPSTLEDPDTDALVLTTSAGNTIRWSSMIDGLGGGCPDDEPNLQVSAFQESENLSGVYYTELKKNGKITQIGLTNEEPVPGDTGSCLFFATFPSKKQADGRLWFGAQIDNPDSADLASIKQVLLSARYNSL